MLIWLIDWQSKWVIWVNMCENFSINIRVYYEDTDFSGHVYHGSYVRFFERARTEWLRNLAIYHSELAKQGLAFVVTHMEVDFIRPAHIDDLLKVNVKIISLQGARIILEQKIKRNKEEISKAKIIVALIGSNSRAKRIPKEWHPKLMPE